jgi:hypothetical protein
MVTACGYGSVIDGFFCSDVVDLETRELDRLRPVAEG